MNSPTLDATGLRRARGLNNPQAWRHLQLRKWLIEGKRFTRKTAAEEFQVSVRTVATDIDQLGLHGYDVSFDQALNSYTLGESSGELPTVQMRRSELAAIILAQQILETFGAEPVADDVERVIERVTDLVPDLLGVDLSSFSPSLSILGGPAPRKPLPHYKALDKAISQTRCVEIEYYTMYRDATSKRIIDPYKMYLKGGHGYLVAWCHLRKDTRIFRLDRISGLRPTESFFDVDPDFDSTTFFGPMFDVFKDDVSFTLKVTFSRWAARWIREDVWHESQVLTDLPDGSIQVDMEVTGATDVKRWVLSYGGDAEVVEPQWLRKEIQDEIGRMQGVYV